MSADSRPGSTKPKPLADAELRKLGEEIKALSVPDQLRLAAGLLEAQRPDMAYSIIDMVRVELGAALALRDARSAR